MKTSEPTPVPSCMLAVKAVPGAPRSEVCGLLAEAVKIKVKAPPVEGKANEALLRFLSEELELPLRQLSLAKGDTSRHKLIRIVGLEEAEVRRRLGVG